MFRPQLRRSAGQSALVLSLLTLVAALSMPPVVTGAETTQTFRDWRADCTDSRLCVLINHAAGQGDEDAVLAFRRRPEPDAPWQIVVSPFVPEIDLTHPFAVSVDGGPKLTFNPVYDFRTYGARDNLFLVNPGLSERLLAELSGGMSATLFYEPDGGGSASVAFRLTGLADGLAWIDNVQSRTDSDRTVAAPDDLEPHASMAGLVTPIDGGLGERDLPVNVLKQHYGVHGCETLDSALMKQTEPIIARLSDTAVLYVIPCTAAGPRTDFRLYIVETGEIGGIETLSFARYSTEYGWTGAGTLTNVAFDADQGVLTSASPAREVDGCGHYARWRWAGIRFALLEYRYRETCAGSGNPDRFPQVFKLAE